MGHIVCADLQYMHGSNHPKCQNIAEAFNTCQHGVACSPTHWCYCGFYLRKILEPYQRNRYGVCVKLEEISVYCVYHLCITRPCRSLKRQPFLNELI